jgi:hypothetical protein
MTHPEGCVPVGMGSGARTLWCAISLMTTCADFVAESRWNLASFASGSVHAHEAEKKHTLLTFIGTGCDGE